MVVVDGAGRPVAGRVEVAARRCVGSAARVGVDVCGRWGGMNMDSEELRTEHARGGDC